MQVILEGERLLLLIQFSYDLPRTAADGAQNRSIYLYYFPHTLDNPAVQQQ